MQQKSQRVYVQRENDKGVVLGWTTGKLSIDDMAGRITVEGSGLLTGKWMVEVRPEQVTNFAIMLISDVGASGMMYGGGLLGYAIAWGVSRFAKMPALQIQQQNATIGNRVANVRGMGFQPRVATRKLMNDIASFLTEKGYKGMMPNLTDEQPWKFPWVPVLIGFAIFIVLLVGLFVCLAAVGSSSNQ